MTAVATRVATDLDQAPDLVAHPGVDAMVDGGWSATPSPRSPRSHALWHAVPSTSSHAASPTAAKVPPRSLVLITLVRRESTLGPVSKFLPSRAGRDLVPTGRGEGRRFR